MSRRATLSTHSDKTYMRVTGKHPGGQRDGGLAPGSYVRPVRKGRPSQKPKGKK